MMELLVIEQKNTLIYLRYSPKNQDAYLNRMAFFYNFAFEKPFDSASDYTHILKPAFLYNIAFGKPLKASKVLLLHFIINIVNLNS